LIEDDRKAVVMRARAGATLILQYGACVVRLWGRIGVGD